MLFRKTTLSQNPSTSHKSLESATSPKYGLLLLHIPIESLSHITAHLDPESLLALGQVNVFLSDHVRQDHIWHRAFACQFLGIHPEADLDSSQSLLLRRSQPTWRKEFILYHTLRRRWQRSNTSTTSHIPLNSPVSAIHMMPGHGLISSSLQYGIVARSVPFNGRILRGYLDAAGSGTGLGIGNPNTEFTPNVSVCALASDGGTAKVAWGFRNGEVAFTSSNKAMDTSSRSAAKFSRCRLVDQHEGPVNDIIWDGNYSLSAGGDGRIKLWDPKHAACLWSSEPRFTDAGIKIASSINQGIVVAAFGSGTILVWSGFTVPDVLPTVPTVTIPAFLQDDGSGCDITALYMQIVGDSLVLLVTLADSVFFYRVDVNLAAGTAERRKFGDEALGPVCSIWPAFAGQRGEHSFVIAGTALGCIGIYDWTNVSKPLPSYQFEAFEDAAAVTALAWNGVTLVTGCAQGTTKVWDAITLGHLRTISSPVPRRRFPAPFMQAAAAVNPGVTQILLGAEKEVLIVAIADHVMAWRAGPVPRGGMKISRSSGKQKARTAVNKHAASKYHQQLELKQELHESQFLLQEESNQVRRVFGREREQQNHLDSLGLDEVEAVEYVLMLSREEAAARAAAEEGVFEGDFDDDHGTASGIRRSESGSSNGSPPSSVSSSPSRISSSTSLRRNGRPIPRAAASTSNGKIQVSPPHRAEPTEASLGRSSPWSIPVATAEPSGAFPTIRGSVSPRGSSAKSAWSKPLVSPGASMTLSSSPRRTNEDEDMDDDLRLAIELSLVEARSRGDF